MITRRAFVVGAVAATSGCGFHPVYGEAGSGAGQGRLAEVYVGLIPNRPGQLLRQALQARLEGTSDVPKRYTLTVGYAESVQGLNVQADNSTTRNRDVSSATWSLHLVDNPGVLLASGTARSVDGYNILDEQFFYANLEQEETQRRQADALANQIALALGVYFDRNPEPKKPG